MKNIFALMICMVVTAQAAPTPTKLSGPHLLPLAPREANVASAGVILGGSTLMVQSNKTLRISKQQQQGLDKELGMKVRDQFYTEMVMESSPQRLKKKYGSVRRPTTLAVIELYQALLQKDTKPVSSVGSL